MNATVGNSLNGQALLLLPNLGRDVTSMAVLQPATAPGGQVAGSAQDANTYTLDGANITDDMSGNVVTYQTNYSGLGGSQGGSLPSGVIPTPIESIEEIKVNVANQTSDFNNSSGGQIQMATKRGTNQFHGSAYGWYFDTTVGSARSWSANHTPTTVNGISYGYTPDRLQPSRPLRRRSRRHAVSQTVPGREVVFLRQLRRAAISQLRQLLDQRTHARCWQAGVIQVQNAQRHLPGVQSESGAR